MIAYGYIRRDFPQTTLEQFNALNIYNCEKIWVDDYEMSSTNELDQMVLELAERDQQSKIIIISDLAALGKNIKQLRQFCQELEKMRIDLISINNNIDTSKQKSYFNIIDEIAGTEAIIRSRQTHEGLKQKKLNGTNLGRPKISEENVKEIIRLHRERCIPLREIAGIIGVSIGSVHKYIKIAERADKENE